MRTTTPPPWQALRAEGYAARMQAKCDALMAEILSDTVRRTEILTDPATLHKELFAEFAPATNAEYAGTYRGTPHTSLADRISGVPSVLGGPDYALAHPNQVNPLMAKLLKDIGTLLAEAGQNHTDNLGSLAYVFAQFGFIHPFLDGNGHVQRALFAAMATEFGYPLSRRFTIHPRPFDALFGIALERFAKASQAEVPVRLVAVMEYLGFFLDGPFNAPGMNLAPENLD